RRSEEAIHWLSLARTEFRMLAALDHDAFDAKLAMTCSNLANACAGIDPEAGLGAADEGRLLYERLAEALPEQHQPELGRVLSFRGDCLRKLGRRRDALTAYAESLRSLEPWQADPRYAHFYSQTFRDLTRLLATPPVDTAE